MEKKKITYLNLARIHDEIRAELDAAYARVMDREWFIQGEECRRFEEEFDAYVQQMVSSSGYESAEAMYSMYGYGDTAYGEAIFRRFYLCDRALDAVKETAVVTVAEAPEEAANGERG